MILSVISIVLLGLIYIVFEKQQINPVWELEYYLLRQKYQALAKLVRAVNKSFTSEEEKQKQPDQIDSVKASMKEFHEILQKEIYLIERKNTLEERRVHTGLNQDENTLLDGIEKDLKQIKPRLWANTQELDDLHLRWFRSSWTFEFECARQSRDVNWKEHQPHCKRRLGCCARECGCCDKPRRASGGQQALKYSYRSHCTIECGCCIRWRGFHHLEKPK